MILNNEKSFINNDFIMKIDVDPETIVLDVTSVEADEDGDKYAHKGQFVDKDGKIITLTDGEGTLTFSSDPVGILTEDVNLKWDEANVEASILRHGLIQAEYLHYPEGVTYKPKYASDIEAKLPHIRCNKSWEGSAGE